MKRTQLLWESNKLSEAETKIHYTEQEMARLKKEFTKLKMRLQESTEKFNEGESWRVCGGGGEGCVSMSVCVCVCVCVCGVCGVCVCVHV